MKKYALLFLFLLKALCPDKPLAATAQTAGRLLQSQALDTIGRHAMNFMYSDNSTVENRMRVASMDSVMAKMKRAWDAMYIKYADTATWSMTQSKAESAIASIDSDIANRVKYPDTMAKIATHNWVEQQGYALISEIPTNVSQLVNDVPYLSSVTWSQVSGKPSFATVATTGTYSDLSGKPVLFSGDYNDLTNKPNIPNNNNQLSNGMGFITSAALSGYATTGALTSGLAGKLNNPTGDVDQYLRGDGSVATFPTIPAQNVYSAAYGIVKVGTEPTASFRVDTANLMTVSSANSTISNMNANINGKVPNSRIITINGVAQDLSADRTWTVNVTAPTYQYTARAVNGTAYQISATKATRVSYTVNVVTALSLLNLTGGGTVFLEVSANGTTGWTTINSAGISRTLSVAISLGLNETTTLNIQGEVPAGWYARLRSATTGTGSTTAFVSGQEVIY